MAMDSYYTDRFDKYANDQGIYHVLFSCPRGLVIKEKHRILGLPPASEHRQPCEACVGEIKDWLTGLPIPIRPSQFQDDVRVRAKHAGEDAGVDAGVDGAGGVASGDQNRGWVQSAIPQPDHDRPEQDAELRQEEIDYQNQGEIVVPE
jgi:hypothetical protein